MIYDFLNKTYYKSKADILGTFTQNNGQLFKNQQLGEYKGPKMNDKKPHRWEKEIKAWAEGEIIQQMIYSRSSNQLGEFKSYEIEIGLYWNDCIGMPKFNDSRIKFRIKPGVVYPETTMNGDQIDQAFRFQGCKGIANAAIKQAIIDGQVDIVDKS